MRLLLQLLVAGSFCWFVASSLWVYPHSLSYFNESIGGPRNGYKHLQGSNVDWGQDYLLILEWLRNEMIAPKDVRLVLGNLDYMTRSMQPSAFAIDPGASVECEIVTSKVLTGRQLQFNVNLNYSHIRQIGYTNWACMR